VSNNFFLFLQGKRFTCGNQGQVFSIFTNLSDVVDRPEIKKKEENK